MNIQRTPPRQHGMALVIGLILLGAATIITVAGLQGMQMQERMTSNQSNKAVSLMAAESGASQFWQWMTSEDFEWDSNAWQNEVPTNAGGEINVGDQGYYWIDPSDVVWGANSVTIIVRGISRIDAENLAETRVRVEFSRPTEGGVDRAFLAGLLSDQDITLNGGPSLTGSAHANGNFSAQGGADLIDRTGQDEDGNPITILSAVSAHGTADIDAENIEEGTNLFQNAERIDVPSASVYINEYVADVNNQYTNSCNIESGDHGGAVYFCDGTADTSGSFSNVTILATEGVNHRGAAQLGGEFGSTLTVSIISGGDITINGRNDTYGVYWAEDRVIQNGRSILGGSVVAGGSITRNGKFNYIQFDDFGNLDLPTSTSVAGGIVSWSQFLQ